MSRAAILGTGLIGASLGLALRAQGWETTGWDPHLETLAAAAARGAVDATPDKQAAIENADLVVLAGPLDANVALLQSIDTSSLVTDVTSVKRPLVRAAPSGIRFVGGHPMAGREHAGPGASSGSLFAGAPWIICSDGTSPTDLAFLEDTVSSIGANPVVMTAAAHDAVVAEISHLPHLLAAVLTAMGSGADKARLVSGSFRDLTRVAAGEAGWWPEVLAANGDEVITAIKKLIDGLAEFGNQLQSRDLNAIRATLDAARSARIAMGPGVATVRVVLLDRPGEIASVGRALEVSRVDVRDLQLRHGEHGGGGILTLSVRPGEESTLRSALENEGFAVE